MYTWHMHVHHTHMHHTHPLHHMHLHYMHVHHVHASRHSSIMQAHRRLEHVKLQQRSAYEFIPCQRKTLAPFRLLQTSDNSAY